MQEIKVLLLKYKLVTSHGKTYETESVHSIRISILRSSCNYIANLALNLLCRRVQVLALSNP